MMEVTVNNESVDTTTGTGSRWRRAATNVPISLPTAPPLGWTRHDPDKMRLRRVKVQAP